MTRQQNPRRIVLAQMREMNSWLRYMVSAWSPTGKVYIPPEERGDALSAWTRPRRVDEYPENQREAWERLAHYMRAVAAQASEIEDYARSRMATIDDLRTNSPKR